MRYRVVAGPLILASRDHGRTLSQSLRLRRCGLSTRTCHPFKGKGFQDSGGKSWLFVAPNPFAKSKLPGANQLWLNAGKKLELRTNVCAVPLLAAPIPKEMGFSTPVLKGGEIEPMPEAQLPGPSCGDRQR